MTKVIGLSGSLRQGSFNSALLREVVKSMPDGAELTVGSIRDIPLYDGDMEAAEGIPAPVTALTQAIMAADGLLLVTPEYNNSIPGVFKNAIDWLSRPPKDSPRIFLDRPVAVVGASPGGFGTVMAQNAWLPVLRTLGTRPWFGARLAVSRAGSVFDADGALQDEKVREQVVAFVAGFAAFIERG